MCLATFPARQICVWPHSQQAKYVFGHIPSQANICIWPHSQQGKYVSGHIPSQAKICVSGQQRVNKNSHPFVNCTDTQTLT